MLTTQTAHKLFSFYLLPGFSLQGFSCAVEVLRLANEAMGRNAYSWQVISGDGQAVMSSCRLTVSSDATLRSERDRTQKTNLTAAAVICGGSTIPSPDRQLDAWLRECRMRRIPLFCLGGGTIVVARAGLADGRRCAVHWEQLPLFCEQFPEIESRQTAFEHDGDLHTCSGGGASFDMFLQLVEHDYGPVVVNRICEKATAYRMRSPGDRQRTPLHSRVKLNHKAVIKVIDLMETSLDNTKSIDDLAALSGTSRRQIERLFEKELGRSPNRYYLELRLERAHLLLVSTNLPVVEIAVACGFASPSYLSKVYRDAYGCSPHQTRSTARANGHADLMEPSLPGSCSAEDLQQRLPMTG